MYKDEQTPIQRQRGRLLKVFEFLKVYTERRYPLVRDIGQQPRLLWLKDLPQHPSVEVFRSHGEADNDSQDADTILRISRPSLTSCPSPPDAIASWLRPGWQDIDRSAEILASRNYPDKDGRARIERFEEVPKRPSLLSRWQQDRAEWQTNERPARQSLAVFQTVYEWYGVLNREGERMELLIGDGLVRCPDAGGEYHHPVLLQKLELELDLKNPQPEFVFRKREQPPELFMEFLRVLPGVNIEQLNTCEEELKKAVFEPLGGGDTEGFLRRLIQGLFPSAGTVIKEDAAGPDTPANPSPQSDPPLLTEPDTTAAANSPTIRRQPVIFMRQRRSDIFERIKEDIAVREVFPASVLQIVGLELATASQGESHGSGLALGNEDDDILLSKPANREQLEIAKQLARKDCVLR